MGDQFNNSHNLSVDNVWILRHVMSLNFPVPSRSFQTELVDNMPS